MIRPFAKIIQKIKHNSENKVFQKINKEIFEIIKIL